MTEAVAARYPGDPRAAAAPLSVPAGGPRARMPSRREHPRAEERDLQRAVLSRTFPRAPGDARRHDHRGPGAGRRDPGFVTADVVPDHQHPLLFRRHRQGALPQAGGAGRPADAHRAAGALAQGHLELLHRGARGGSGSGARGHDGGPGGRQVIDARAIVSPQAAARRGCERRARSASSARRCRSARAPWSVRTRSSTARPPSAPTTTSSSSPPSAMRRRTRSTRASPPGSRSAIATCFARAAPMNRGTSHDKGVTRIGNDNLFMAYSHVAHDCMVGSNTVFANCASLGGHVEIGDWVILGGLTAVHQFTKIGAHAFLAGGAISDAMCRRTSWSPATRRCRTRSTPRASSAAASPRSRSAISATPTASSIARS